jgi:hypothetical protein
MWFKGSLSAEFNEVDRALHALLGQEPLTPDSLQLLKMAVLRRIQMCSLWPSG